MPCALPAVGIASHLDAATTSSACRLAFHGLMLRRISKEELAALRVFKRKFKEGSVERVQDATTVICKGLFKPGTDMNMFLGMQVQLGDHGPVGRIDGTFGKTKFKCVFPETERGIEGLQEACHKARLYLRSSTRKRMVQTSSTRRGADGGERRCARWRGWRRPLSPEDQARSVNAELENKHHMQWFAIRACLSPDAIVKRVTYEIVNAAESRIRRRGPDRPCASPSTSSKQGCEEPMVYDDQAKVLRWI